MCGGSGTRLWPLSTSDTPKQFLCLVDDTLSMFQLTCKLASSAGASELILISNERFLGLVQEQLTAVQDEIPSWRIVIEPVSRNTAPAIAAGILGEDDEIIVVMPSDHVWDSDSFNHTIRDAIRTAEDNKTIVTIGISPTYPETGYGYIEASWVNDGVAKEVLAFREKPTLETAEEYLKKGTFFWNAGVFVFKGETMLDEMIRLTPDILNLVSRAYDKESGLLDVNVFCHVEDISIDYAIMEHTVSSHVVVYTGEWSDIGSFRTLKEISEKDSNGNTFKGRVRQLHTKNTLVLSNEETTRFNLIGVSDLIIVQSADSSEILITTPDLCQEVKTINKI